MSETTPRKYLRSAVATLTWLTNPKRVDKAFEMAFGLAGGMVQREFNRFAADPVGARLLREKPNLLEAISDREALAAMPEGSFGRAFLSFMSQANMEDAAAISKEANLPELGRRLGWSEDVAWFVERMSNTHDVFHVLAGYGRDLAGEGATITFTFGQFPIPALWPMILGIAALRPKGGWRRWHQYLRVAHKRGENASPMTCTPYEDMLPMPLEKVREQIGITAPESAHVDGVMVDWMGITPDKALQL